MYLSQVCLGSARHPCRIPLGLCHTHSLRGLTYIHIFLISCNSSFQNPHFLSLVVPHVTIAHQTLTLHVKVSSPSVWQPEKYCSQEGKNCQYKDLVYSFLHKEKGLGEMSAHKNTDYVFSGDFK